MILEILKGGDYDTIEVEVSRGFATVDESWGQSGLSPNISEARVCLSQQQAKALAGWLNQALYGVVLREVRDGDHPKKIEKGNLCEREKK